MTGHSAAPWVFVEDKGAHLGGIKGSDGRWVCDFGVADPYESSEGEPPTNDDGRLMAAAPELLAALVAAIPFIDDSADVWSLFPESAATNACRKAVIDARAAIAKATGAQP